MRKSIVAAGAIAAALLASGTAEACATVSFSPGTVTLPTWDPIIGPAVESSFNVSVTRSGSPPTTDIRFIMVDSAAGSPTRLSTAGPIYRVEFDGTTISHPLGTNPDAVPANRLDIPTPDNSPVVRALKIVVPANSAQQDFVGGSSFPEPLGYSIRCVRTNNSVVSGSGTGIFTANLTIPKLVSITTASPQTINFGNFTTATQQLNIALKSTSSINVSVSTSNVNQMVLAGAVSPYPANSVILYTMTLNNDPIASGTTLTNRPRAGVAGTNWPLVLTLTGGVPNGKLAGSYSDTITLTLTPGT